MTDSIALSSLLTPLIRQFNPKTILTAGETAASCLQTDNDTRLQHLTTPFKQQQLHDIEPVDLAVISHLTESLEKPAAWRLKTTGNSPTIWQWALNILQVQRKACAFLVMR